MAQIVKRLPTMRETWVQSLGRENPMEKEMAIHSSIRVWKIPRMEEPGRLQSTGSQSRTGPSDFTFTLHIFLPHSTFSVPILWPPHAELTHWKKTLMPGGVESGRRGRQRMRWLDGITDSTE